MIAFASALLLAQAGGPAIIRVDIVQAGERCGTAIAGRPFSGEDRTSLDAALAGRSPEAVTVEIVGGQETSYRCIGGAVYTLQMMGFREVRFVTAPPGRPPAR